MLKHVVHELVTML